VMWFARQKSRFGGPEGRLSGVAFERGAGKIFRKPMGSEQ
jgi:hypothetical protein